MVVLEDDKWKFVTRLPVDVANTSSYQLETMFPGHLLLICETKKYVEQKSDAYELDLKELIWTKLQVPIEYSGEVFSACWLII